MKTTDGHGRLKSGELEERKCAYGKCDAHFECDKSSPKKYHSPRCSTLDAADKVANQARIKEAIRICKSQRCPQKTVGGACGGRLTREGILVYCTKTDCSYSFNATVPGAPVKREIVEDAVSDDEADGGEERVEEDKEEAEEGWAEEAEEEEDVQHDAEGDVEGESAEILQGGDDEGRVLSELDEGCGLFSDPLPDVSQKQLVLLLAKLDKESLEKVVLTAKRLHAVIHTMEEMP